MGWQTDEGGGSGCRRRTGKYSAAPFQLPESLEGPQLQAAPPFGGRLRVVALSETPATATQYGTRAQSPFVPRYISLTLSLDRSTFPL